MATGASASGQTTRQAYARPARARRRTRWCVVRPGVVRRARSRRLDQQRVVDHGAGPLLVLAGPGTGKTTTIVEAVVARIDRGLDPEQILVLTFARKAAAELRERITARLARATKEPLARTFHSYAFGVLRREAALRGEPTPRLLSGPEQDLVIRDLLAGDIADGARAWPVRLHPALGTRGLRPGAARPDHARLRARSDAERPRPAGPRAASATTGGRRRGSCGSTAR